jgi:hypothetical protein
MDLKDAKGFLTPFDIFSQIIPGAIIVFAIYVHERVFVPSNSFTALMAKVFPAEQMTNLDGTANWYYYIVATIGALLVIYVLGHIVSSLGSILIDRMLINRIHEYPYKRLLETLFEKKSRGVQKRRYNKAAFFAFILLNVALAFATAWPRLMFGLTIFLVVAIFAILALKEYARSQWQSDEAKESSRQSAWGESSKPPENPKADTPQPPNCVRKVFRKFLSLAVAMCEMAVTVLQATYDWLARGLISLFRIGRAFPVDFQQMVKDSFEKVYKRAPNRLGTNVFWLAALDVAQAGDRQLKLLMQAWHLYGLMRSMAIAFYILWLYDIMVLLLKTEQHAKFEQHLWWIVTTGLCALLCTLRYYHIYYCHFTWPFADSGARNTLILQGIGVILILH